MLEDVVVEAELVEEDVVEDELVDEDVEVEEVVGMMISGATILRTYSVTVSFIPKSCLMRSS